LIASPPAAVVALLLLGAGAGAVFAQSGGGGGAAAVGSAERGQAFVRANSAACHAVGGSGNSPLAAAPAFRDLHRRYPVEHLAEAFAEGVAPDHPGMPEFELDRAQIADLIAYLQTLGR
jgi:cytochrome c